MTREDPRSGLVVGAPAPSVEELFRDFEAAMTPRVDLNSKWERGESPYVPLGIDEFLRQCNVAWGAFGQRPSLRFVDVGCGIGTKAWIAQKVFFMHVTGLEVTHEYATFARRLLPEPGVVVEVDARTYDYSAFDVIYFFGPMTPHPDKERELEEQIARTMRRGAIVLANAWQSNVWRQPNMELLEARKREFAGSSIPFQNIIARKDTTY